MSSIKTKFKIAIRMEPIDGFHMGDVHFYADFYLHPHKKLRISKTQMTKESDDCYIAIVDSSKLVSPQVLVTKGQIKYVLYAAIPDSICENGIRDEYSNETLCENCTLT